MPDTRKHRGPGPQDQAWFGSASRSALVAGVADLSWLLSRGYAEASSLKLVGDHHRLVERQRTAILRSACSEESLRRRRASQVHIESLKNQALRIDGFNLVVTLESALAGGIILRGRDGCFRDLASVHGTYRRVEETQPALDLATRWLSAWGVGPCTWLLDAPVSNSGRLAAMIRATNAAWCTEVVPDPDALLVMPGDPVITADARILDACNSWVNLAQALVEVGVPGAFIVDLG